MSEAIFWACEADGGLSFVSVKAWDACEVDRAGLDMFRSGFQCGSHWRAVPPHGSGRREAGDVPRTRLNSGFCLLRPPEERVASRLERFRQRRSALFSLCRGVAFERPMSRTEVGIYIILLFVPVFQLFIQDGLVSTKEGVNTGVLASHVLQGQAGLCISLKKLRSIHKPRPEGAEEVFATLASVALH